MCTRRALRRSAANCHDAHVRARAIPRFAPAVLGGLPPSTRPGQLCFFVFSFLKQSVQMPWVNLIWLCVAK
jgi:hypothetical protein